LPVARGGVSSRLAASLLHIALLHIALLHIALLHIALLHIALLHIALPHKRARHLLDPLPRVEGMLARAALRARTSERGTQCSARDAARP